MRKNAFFIFMLWSVSIGFVAAQNVTDVVRYSSFRPGGTARVLGVGGSFGAMGGDYGIININPAGLGEYKKSEFMFTPSLNLTNTQASLVADPTRRSDLSSSRFGIDNIALVISSEPSSSRLNYSNFAIGYSRIADLNRTFEYRGVSQGSITERFVERANGLTEDELDEWEAYPAYVSGAIFGDPNFPNQYFSDFVPTDFVDKQQTVSQRGSVSEINFAWAGNLDQKLNFGISMGIPIVSFSETKVYTELDPQDEIPIFNRLEYTEVLNTSGTGFNFKAGFIYNANRIFRFGASIHSPTWFRLSDDYFTNIEYDFTLDNGPERGRYESDPGFFRYKLNTPWRFVGSVGSIFELGALKGFVNADLEWLDYTSSSLDFTAFSSDPSEIRFTNEANNEIRQQLDRAAILRLGTELAYEKIRFRLGWERGHSPYRGETVSSHAYGFGFGIREDLFFIDFGVRIRSLAEGFNAYSVLDSDRNPLVNVENNRTNILITTGFKF